MVITLDRFSDSQVEGLVEAERHAPGVVPGRLAGPVGRRRPGRRGQPADLAGQACWYLVATEDRMIPPAAQRAMADRAGASVSEIAASHAVYVSQPQVVADLIKQAAAAAGG